jgi:hypothetical protein
VPAGQPATIPLSQPFLPENVLAAAMHRIPDLFAREHSGFDPLLIAEVATSKACLADDRLTGSPLRSESPVSRISLVNTNAITVGIKDHGHSANRRGERLDPKFHIVLL